MFCTWLVAYCKVRGIHDDLVEIPYKQPYIEMYEEIRDGINENDFSVEQITIFFEETSDLLFRECKDCKNSEKIRIVAFATRSGTINSIGMMGNVSKSNWRCSLYGQALIYMYLDN